MLYGSGARMEKGNGRYSFWSNLRYHYHNLRKWEPMIFIMGFVIIIPWMAADLVGNILPSKIVEGLEEGWELEKLLLTTGALIVMMMIARTLNSVLEAFTMDSSALYREHYSAPYIDKKMNVDYATLENAEFNTVANASYTAIYTGRGINDAVSRLPSFLMFLLPAIVYAFFLAQVRWWFPVVSLITAGLQVYMLKVARQKHSESHPILSNYAGKLAYLTNETMEIQAGKDIRIFKMQKWLNKKYAENLNAMNKEYDRIHRWYFLKNGSDAILDIVRNGVIYSYLLWLTVNGKITLAEFVLYYGFTNSFSENLIFAMRNMLGFGIISNTFSSIRDYFDTPEKKRQGTVILSDKEMEEIKKQPLEIEFKDVSFQYEGAKKEVISSLNLKIKAGEKLALIGLNGAGKTTLVKLICGFYTPTKGEILVNGKDIQTYDRDQYYELISVLFQDYVILPMSLDENIASQSRERIDSDRLKEALVTSGFQERYQKLEKGGESMLVREINEEAVDFSGGEKQRMLFARSLYKKAPLLILDEPTAALDPIAENELYLKFSESTKGKTSVFISHRLSSTRFCDRIVLLENGNIVECGTHGELMDSKGRYYELYEMQSRYYKEEELEAKRKQAMEEA